MADRDYELSEQRLALMERLSRSADATSEIAARYRAVLHQTRLSRARELRATSRGLRERLHAAVDGYVAILREEGTPPHVILWLVKDTLDSGDLALDPRRSDFMEEVERWAVDAYYAA